MRLAVALITALLAFPAAAANWVVDVPHSSLTFSGTQGGEAFTGRFTRFMPVIDFDPAAPQKGSVTVTIDMTSATIDDKDKQASLPTEDWFFTQKFPTATFTSHDLLQAGEGGYTASGTLTIRGIPLEATLPFTLREEGGITHAEGSIILQRNQFGVGQGQWKDDKWIGYPVTVKFHLLAKPQT